MHPIYLKTQANRPGGNAGPLRNPSWKIRSRLTGNNRPVSAHGESSPGKVICCSLCQCPPNRALQCGRGPLQHPPFGSPFGCVRCRQRTTTFIHRSDWHAGANFSGCSEEITYNDFPVRKRVWRNRLIINQLWRIGRICRRESPLSFEQAEDAITRRLRAIVGLVGMTIALSPDWGWKSMKSHARTQPTESPSCVVDILDRESRAIQKVRYVPASRSPRDAQGQAEIAAGQHFSVTSETAASMLQRVSRGETSVLAYPARTNSAGKQSPKSIGRIGGTTTSR